eukprot:6471124-Amphidinium_carterae.1
MTQSWRSPSMHVVAANHALAEHKRIHTLWKKQKGISALAAISQPRARPLWAHSKMARRKRNLTKPSAFNAFVSEQYARESQPLHSLPHKERHVATLRALSKRWKELSTSEQERFAIAKQFPSESFNTLCCCTSQ